MQRNVLSRRITRVMQFSFPGRRPTPPAALRVRLP
jgi:hypothetical protein